MTDTDLDRERIACVFGLGGGELHVPHPDFPDSEGWDGVIAHWYEGVPEYATELRHLDGARTAILDCLFGVPEPPPGWRQVASFSSSGEAVCWWCYDRPGDDDDDHGLCPLCEGDGYVYFGDGWCEAVYVPVECADPIELTHRPAGTRTGLVAELPAAPLPGA